MCSSQLGGRGLLTLACGALLLVPGFMIVFFTGRTPELGTFEPFALPFAAPFH